MDFRFDPPVEVFRAEVCEFLKKAMAPDRTLAHADESDLTGLDESFERTLLREAGVRGYLGISYPEQVGGRGRPLSYQAAFELEVARHDAPLIDTAVTLAGRALLAWGGPSHRRILRQAVAGQITMCIAYTEHQAGSDLSAVQTTVTPARGALEMQTTDGDGELVLSGRKTLVTGAHKSDWCLTIARAPHTSGRHGLSMLLVDMQLPGVKVRRLPTMSGWTLCDVDFEAVRVPSDSVLGARDKGWRQLVASVAMEGGFMFYVGFAESLFAKICTFLSNGERASLTRDPLIRDQLGRLRMELDAAHRLARRAVDIAERGGDASVQSAMSKVYGTELLQRMAAVAADVVGADASALRPLFGPDAPASDMVGRFGRELLERVHGTIGGGTNEVKRNLIATVGLGLPRPEVAS